MAFTRISLHPILGMIMLLVNGAVGELSTVITTQLYSNYLGGSPLTLVDTITTSTVSATPTILAPTITCLSSYPADVEPFLECIPASKPSVTSTLIRVPTIILTIDIDTKTLVNISTTTTTQAPITITRTVSEVMPTSSQSSTKMVTSTALCFNGKDSVVEPCVEVYPAPSNSTKKNSAATQMCNPFSSLPLGLKSSVLSYVNKAVASVIGWSLLSCIWVWAEVCGIGIRIGTWSETCINPRSLSGGGNKVTAGDVNGRVTKISLEGSTGVGMDEMTSRKK